MNSDDSILVKQISDRAKEIRTDGYAMSIGEVLSLYRDGDIEIHPEFQRIFRWDDDQKSKLIESILLGIPIPSIFVSQREDGVWDVIDGVQRISTILQFVGEYVDEGGNRQPGLILRQGEYLTSLEGYKYFKDDDEDDSPVFNEALRRDFKRAKLELRIITKESDENAKYDLFQRLNSGSILSPQEARNCLMVMINKPFYEQVNELSQNVDFMACVPLTDRQEDRAYRSELVLRFFCQVDFSAGSSELKKEYGDYLTDWMRRRAAGSDLLDAALFDKTFGLLNGALGEDSFRRLGNNGHTGPFSISGYEFVTSGVSHNIASWENKPQSELAERIKSIWSAPIFKSNSGTGVSPRRRVPRLVNASREYFGQ
ncbi:DUF262 domain-containing protein [Nocardia wallacei]|uniref:DUF262 domain-containing protein n=1 Tax=Nocardia wallacei TaxID=480035 RepID=UPI002455A98B|nr:DUF262 domain-containing protein [Nocardia wallacei]